MKDLATRLLGTYLNALAIFSPSSAAQKGFMLFCRPFRVKPNERQLNFLNAAERFTLKQNGNSIQAYKWGDGPKKVLFLHGWQSHSYRWKSYVQAFPKDEYTLLALDAPGHGLSQGNFLSVPLYSSLIEEFIREQGKLDACVAHSLGGFSLLYTLYRQPELPVDRLVLLAPPGEANEFVAAFKQTLRLTDRAVNLVIDEFLKRYNVSPEFFTTRRFVEKVNAPGLIIHDRYDRDAPYHHSPPLLEVWRKSRLITTEGFGHNLKSTSVIQEVVSFITETHREPSVV